MIILITLYLVFGWQFPMWLWILSGFFLLTSLFSRKDKIKKTGEGIVLPLSLALGLIFGTNASGEFIFPEDVSVWVVIGILIGSFVLRLALARPDKMIRKEWSKKKKVKDSNVEVNINTTNDDDDELKLHFSVINKEKNKTSNFKITLNNGFIKEKFVENVILKGMKKGWENNPDYQDNDGKPLFDIEEIYNEAKKNPIRGEIITIDNEKVNVTISIK